MVHLIAFAAVAVTVAGDFLTSEDIVFVSEAPPQVRALDEQYKVGYYFKSFAGLVNYDGEFVLYHNEIAVEYLRLTDSDWRELIGDEPAAVYEVPFLYRWPHGWFWLGGLTVVVVVTRVWSRFKSKRKAADHLSVENLKNDERMAAGVSHYIQACVKAGVSPYAMDGDLFRQAVEYLVDEQGVARPDALLGFGVILQHMHLLAAQEQQEAAAKLEESRNYEEALDAYEEAADLFDSLDASHAAFVRRECVGRVQKRIDQFV